MQALQNPHRAEKMNGAHKSKLPFRCRFIAMHLLTSTKKTFSAKEIQRQLSRNRYHPVQYMVHRFCQAMGKRDGEYVLEGRIEPDEGVFFHSGQEEKGKPEFSQNYPDGFCYKVNLRYFGEVLLGRLLVACESYRNDFRYKHR